MIRVLVVDDSAFMRQMISDMLDVPGIEVIETARNGQDALDKLERIDPDVITLDVEMPEMNGLEFLKKLTKERPLPVIMLSSLTEANNMTTIKSLELGAVDFIPKPSGNISLDIDKIEKELIEKVKVAADTKLTTPKLSVKSKRTKRTKEDTEDKESDRKRLDRKRKKVKSKAKPGEGVVVIGASTGGPRALKEVITNVDGDFKFGILLVQHMPPNFTTSLAERLNRLSDLRVKEAEENEEIRPGKVLLAPGDRHMVVNDSGRVNINQEEKVHNVRPAIDLTMESAVEYYGDKVIGTILTGMGKDGTRGLKAIKAAGGHTIAQDKETSTVYGMPKAAFQAGVVDSVKALPLISSEIMRFARKIN